MPPMIRAPIRSLMNEAFRLAIQGYVAGEVPVGAVVAGLDGQILGRGLNRCIELNDPTAHAEILAIREASQRLRNYRLTHSILVCTLEPCPMCYSAILNARIPLLVYALEDPEGGAISLRLPLDVKGWKPPLAIRGYGRERGLEIMKSFFQTKREG